MDRKCRSAEKWFKNVGRVDSEMILFLFAFVYSMFRIR